MFRELDRMEFDHINESSGLPEPIDNSEVQATRVKIERKTDGLLRLTIHSGPTERSCFLLPDELASDLQVGLTNLNGLPGREEDKLPEDAD